MQKQQKIIGKRRGNPVYPSNPSVPDAKTISKRKKVRYGDEHKGFLFDTNSGEVLNVGGAAFYEFEEVDDGKFVKMFLAGIKQAVGLSKTGLKLFEVVYKQMQETPGADEVKLSYYTASQHVEGLAERTYQRGLKELIDKEFLFHSPSEGVFFVNIRFMFNGDRLAFVKGYKRRTPNTQGELDLNSEKPSD